MPCIQGTGPSAISFFAALNARNKKRMPLLSLLQKYERPIGQSLSGRHTRKTRIRAIVFFAAVGA